MFYVDFARVLLRDLDEKIAATEGGIWSSEDFLKFCEIRARRNALGEARRIITDRLRESGDESI